MGHVRNAFATRSQCARADRHVGNVPHGHAANPSRRAFGAQAEPAKFAYSEWVLGKGPRGADFYDNPNGELLHLQAWIDAVRTRRQPNAPVPAGVSAASAAHLANQALREGKVAHYGA